MTLRLSLMTMVLKAPFSAACAAPHTFQPVSHTDRLVEVLRVAGLPYVGALLTPRPSVTTTEDVMRPSSSDDRSIA